MATPIGGITIDIDAKVTKLEESLKRANNDLKKFEKQSYGSTKNIEKNVSGINKSFQMLGASIAGFAAGIGIRTFIDLGRYALGFADDLATAADQAGIGAVRFQSLRETFRILEIDGAAFEKSMVRLNGTLGDVLRGSVDEATKALEQMGLTSKILSGEISTTDQLLDGIADSAKSFGTQAEFTSAVVDIFGRRVGGQLAPALAKGTAAINEMEQAAIDAGIVIDELSLNKLADANEAVERFTVQTQMQFVSWFGSVISGFEDLGLAIEGWKMKLAEPISWGGVKEFFTMTNREAANLARYRNANPMSGAVSGAFGAFQNISNRVQSLTAPRAPRLSTGGGRSGGGRARSGGGGAPKISDEQRLTQEFEKQVLANERILELQTTRHQGFEVAADIQEAYYQLQEKFPKLEQGRLEILRQQYRQIELQKDSYAEIQGIMADWQGSEFIADQEAIADSLEDLMKTNGFGADAIEGNNIRIAKSFKDMANETLGAVQEMTNALQGGSFLDILGAFINVGLQLGSIGLFGKGMQTNINKSVPGYARGTNSAKAGLAMVGEEGPEMVLFGGGERVVPNDKLRSARSGTTDIQVIPSPYFDVVVDGRVMSAAPGIAQGGAQLASQRSAFANSRRLA